MKKRLLTLALALVMALSLAACGGSGLQSKDSGSTAEAQLSVVRETCEHIAELSVSNSPCIRGEREL